MKTIDEMHKEIETAFKNRFRKDMTISKPIPTGSPDQPEKKLYSYIYIKIKRSSDTRSFHNYVEALIKPIKEQEGASVYIKMHTYPDPTRKESNGIYPSAVSVSMDYFKMIEASIEIVLDYDYFKKEKTPLL